VNIIYLGDAGLALATPPSEMNRKGPVFETNATRTHSHTMLILAAKGRRRGHSMQDVFVRDPVAIRTWDLIIRRRERRRVKVKGIRALQHTGRSQTD
jgi:hypothetical protein